MKMQKIRMKNNKPLLILKEQKNQLIHRSCNLAFHPLLVAGSHLVYRRDSDGNDTYNFNK